MFAFGLVPVSEEDAAGRKGRLLPARTLEKPQLLDCCCCCCCCCWKDPALLGEPLHTGTLFEGHAGCDDGYRVCEWEADICCCPSCEDA